MRKGQALRGPHGAVYEYLEEGDYLGQPGAKVRGLLGISIVPASHIGNELMPVPGQVVTVYRETGRWCSPVESWLEIDDAVEALPSVAEVVE